MRRRYGDCQRTDGNCAVCSLVNYGRDCHNKPISKLAWARMASGMDQPTLAAKSGINIRSLQKFESGESSTENITAKNLLAIAKVLGVNPEELI